MPGYFLKALSSCCHVTVCGVEPGGGYPADITFNVACAGSVAFIERLTAPEISSFLEKRAIHSFR
jgi:hypothetical protein